MQVSAEFCRKQEALQLAKAAHEPLETRRTIAMNAAKAWAVMALVMEKRLRS